MSMKKRGFTLGEVLITLSVVGMVAILTIPSLTGDIAAKHRMAKLTNTIGDLNNAVQLYMMRERVSVIDSTNEDFQDELKKLMKTKDGYASLYTYGSIRNPAVNNNFFNIHFGTHGFILENGVHIKICGYNGLTDRFYVAIDVNGADKPNIIGLDMFIATLYKQDIQNDDGDVVVHAGDIGMDIAEDEENLLENCTSGDLNNHLAACYSLAEQKGFAPDYYKE